MQKLQKPGLSLDEKPADDTEEEDADQTYTNTPHLAQSY